VLKYLEVLIQDRRRASGEDFDSLPTLEELKTEYIDYLLDRTFQNKSETARILDISRTALYYRLAGREPEDPKTSVIHTPRKAHPRH
jgi:DNA-binding NtrC family response regulator